MPLWASVIEPFSAIFTIVVGAPDYQAAAFSTAFWIFLFGFVGFLVGDRCKSQRPLWLSLLHSSFFGSGCTLLFMLYMLLAVLLPLPSWSLAVDKPETTIVADLHSHTTASHDGLVSARRNLAIHHDRGYGVVALTEHFSTELRPQTSEPALTPADLTKVIFGTEISEAIEGRAYFLFLGVKLGADTPLRNKLLRMWDEPSLRDVLHIIRDEMHGAILMEAWTLKPEDIERYLAFGVDGFEIANFGHPEITAALGPALVQAQKTHGIALVATSDWHGWSGSFKTWTLFRLSAPTDNPAAEVVKILRSRDPGRVVPVVSQVFETPSALRRHFSPFVEAVRYGRELSPPRLASWWIWTALLIWIAHRLRRLRLNPAGTLLIAIQAGLGAGVAVRAVQLMVVTLGQEAFDHSRLVGSIGLASGLIALVAAWFNRAIVVRSIFAVGAGAAAASPLTPAPPPPP
jgi:hypothetical protein